MYALRKMFRKFGTGNAVRDYRLAESRSPRIYAYFIEVDALAFQIVAYCHQLDIDCHIQLPEIRVSLGSGYTSDEEIHKTREFVSQRIACLNCANE
jgi:hypothetical protein